VLVEDKIFQQASQYDKIIKENLEVTLPVMIRDVLHLDIRESVELPDDIQHTKERKPDLLKKITDSKGNTYILHLEFQHTDEKKMIYRMADYYIMLMRKYELPIKQYLIFLKDSVPEMPSQIQTENLRFEFALIRLAKASYNVFLKSNHPEVKMLAILADFGSSRSDDVVKIIVDEIDHLTKDYLNKSRYFKQLRILAQLRTGIEQEILKAMQGISSFFKIENDPWYKEGEKIGAERKVHTVVAKLLSEFSFSDEQAARAVNVPIEYVRNLRKELKST